MKSHFGAVHIDTARKWTTPELYLALFTHKNEFLSPPELRNYGPETGLYLDAVGIYTLYFLPNEISGVTLKLWCPWHALRIAPSRRGGVDKNYPGKAEATPLLEQTADTVSRILLEAEAQNLTFDTALVPPESDWELPYRAWLPLAAASWTDELVVNFTPPICLTDAKKSAILCRCPDGIHPESVIFYAEARAFLRPNDVFVLTEDGIFGCIGKPFSIIFADLAAIETDLGGNATLTKTDGSIVELALSSFGKPFADIARKAVAYRKEHTS